MQCDKERSEDILQYVEFRLKEIEFNVLCVTCYVLRATRYVTWKRLDEQLLFVKKRDEERSDVL